MAVPDVQNRAGVPSPAAEYDHLYKVVLVGDATVGKTHLVTRYCRGTLPRTPQATIGVEFATRTVPLKVGGTVKAQVWDTAGQERYRAITAAHYRRAVGALLVYDVTRMETFINAAQWLEDLRQSAEPDLVVMLVGNKVDIIQREPARRAVPYDQASAFAKAQGLLFMETSAVTTANVKEAFELLLQEVYNVRSANAEQHGGLYADTLSGGTSVIAAGGGPMFNNQTLPGGIKLNQETTKNNDGNGCCNNG